MPPSRHLRSLGVAVLSAVTLSAPAGCTHSSAPASVGTRSLPLRQVASIGLPGDSSRFDYASLDPARGLLFIAHLGASEVIEVDVRSRHVVRTIEHISDVHGVLVVPDLQRVYATATGSNQLVALDERTGRELGRASTGAYPDGLAYDPENHTIWTTDESGGTETVVDAATMAVRGTVPVGDSVGNVAYDPTAHQMLVAVQSANTLAAVDPATLQVIRTLQLSGCQHDHGLALDSSDRLAFIGCDENAELLTVDLTAWRVLGSDQVGADPDVLSYDSGSGRLVVAAESGWLTILARSGRSLTVLGRDFFADGAHVVTLDPATHHAYLPVPHGPHGQPSLMEEAITE